MNSGMRLEPGPIHGTVRVPPSKSYTHRAIVAGYLTGRRYRIRRPLDSGDTRATLAGVVALGADVQVTSNEWILDPAEPSESRSRTAVVRCGSSGTTLRFLSALAAARSTTTQFVGSAELARRPNAELLEALERAGAVVALPRRNRSVPCRIRGPIAGGRWVLRAALSSQFVSSLLFVLPTLPESSELRLRGPVVSRPYVSATLRVIRSHHVSILDDPDRYRIPAPQEYRGRDFEVPGDASSAAYFAVAAAVTGGAVRLTHLNRDWPQADLRAVRLLREIGATVRWTSTRSLRVAGTELAPFDVDFTDSPDLVPLFGVLAATLDGRTSILRGARQLEYKESDRRLETVALVRSLGARARTAPGRIEVTGIRRPRALHLRHLRDHRMIMAAAVGALAASRPSVLGPAHSVAKSYPGFWNAMRSVGAAVARVP